MKTAIDTERQIVASLATLRLVDVDELHERDDAALTEVFAPVYRAALQIVETQHQETYDRLHALLRLNILGDGTLQLVVDAAFVCGAAYGRRLARRAERRA